MNEVLACLEAALAVGPLHVVEVFNRGGALDQLGAPPEEWVACYSPRSRSTRCTPQRIPAEARAAMANHSP